MLINKRIFARLMALLRSINPQMMLPLSFEHFLWQHMNEMHCKTNTILEHQGKKPKHAYFVVRGFITLHYIDKEGEKHVTRIYRENEICGLISFIAQLASPYTIEVSKGAMLLSVSNKAMQQLYTEMPGMKEFAMRTSMEYESHMEQLRENMLSKSVDEKVAQFYDTFTGPLHKRKIINDEDIIRYLLICLTSLKNARRRYKVERKIAEKELF